MTLIEDSAFHQRLADFAADVDGKHGVTLPGWQEFGELVGRDGAARELFVDMQREEPQMLQRMFDPASPDRQLDWEGQIGRLLSGRNFNPPGQMAIPAGSTATLLFLGSLPNANISDSGAAGLRQLTQIPPLSESLASKSADNAIRRLVCAWIIHCPNRSSIILQQRLDAMFQHSLSECLPLALGMLEPKPEYLTVPPQQQMLAILAVGKFGSEETLERWNHCSKMQRNACHGSKSMGRAVTWRQCKFATSRWPHSCGSPVRNRSPTDSSTPGRIRRCSLTSRRYTSNLTIAAVTHWNNGAPGGSNIRARLRGPPAARFFGPSRLSRNLLPVCIAVQLCWFCRLLGVPRAATARVLPFHDGPTIPPFLVKLGAW